MKQLFIPATDIINAVNANKEQFACLAPLQPFNMVVKENLLYTIVSPSFEETLEIQTAIFELIDWLAEWTHPTLAIWQAQNKVDECDDGQQPIIDKELIQTLINLAHDGVKLRNLRERAVAADSIKKAYKILKELEA